MSEQPPEKPKRTPGPGRGNKWIPSDEEKMAAFCLAAMGANSLEIAFHLHRQVKLVDERLAKEIAMGVDQGNQVIKAKLFRKALGSGIHSTDGETAALIYLAKVRMGWWDRPPAFAAPHPNDSLPVQHEELCVEVRYRYSRDAQALPPPPADRLPAPASEA